MNGSPPPVIRQVALIMLALCLAVPVALWLRAPRAAERLHEPARTRGAIDALLAAVAPVTSPSAMPDAAGVAALLPQCAGLPPYQGLAFADDVAEQFGLLDQQLAALTAADAARNAPLRARYQLQPARWAVALPRERAACQPAVQALRVLAGPRGAALLAQARWGELERRGGGDGTATTAPAVQLAANSLAQADPWRGWPGCVWLGGLQPGSTAYHLGPAGRGGMGAGAGSVAGRALCEQAGWRPANVRQVAAAHAAGPGTLPGADDPAWAVPADLGTLIAELDALRLPQGKLYQDYAAQQPEGANRTRVGRNEVDVGFNLQLTIEPRTQAVAQRIAACYTGQTGACAQAGLAPAQVGTAQGPGAPAMWEHAVARMTAVAVIDVASGRIEALASAHTPCYAQDNDGPFRDAGCLPLWTEPRLRPDALLNHAVFTDTLPGSTIKPILASVFLEDADADAEHDRPRRGGRAVTPRASGTPATALRTR